MMLGTRTRPQVEALWSHHGVDIFARHEGLYLSLQRLIELMQRILEGASMSEGIQETSHLYLGIEKSIENLLEHIVLEDIEVDIGEVVVEIIDVLENVAQDEVSAQVLIIRLSAAAAAADVVIVRLARRIHISLIVFL